MNMKNNITSSVNVNYKKIILILLFILLLAIILFEGFSLVQLLSKEEEKCPDIITYRCINNQDGTKDYSYYLLEDIVIDSLGTIKKADKSIIYEYNNKDRYLTVKNNQEESELFKYSFYDDEMKVVAEVVQTVSLVDTWYKLHQDSLIEQGYECNVVVEENN